MHLSMKKIFAITFTLINILFISCDKKVVYPPEIIPGSNGSISGLNTYNGNLIIGGRFDSVGSIAAHNIAQWNGTKWSGIGFSGSDSIKFFTVYNGNLIAAGHYGIIYEYNGSVWSTILSDNTKAIEAIIVYNGNLVLGGYDYNTNGAYLAQWNGSNWGSIARFPIAGLNHAGYVYSLASFNGNLVAGGTFDSINGILVNNIAQWNGSTWSGLGSGIGEPSNTAPTMVYAVCVFNANLVIGGILGEAANSLGNLAQWNGLSWQKISNGMSEPINDLIVDSGNLIATDYASDIEEWNGASWNSITFNGYSTNGYPDVMQVYNGNLYICGYFATVNGATAYNIAQYNGTTWSPLP